jgi:predicted deacetylase
VSDRHLLVSIHDVTPAHERRIQRALALLAEFEVERFALLVVPDWHGSWPLGRFEAFASAVRACGAGGAEVLLHGFRHDEAGSSRTVLQHVRTWGRTAREAEFLGLLPDEADRRIAEGCATLRSAGLEPTGFVPPAWFHGRGLGTVLRAHGFTVTEDAWSVIDLVRHRHIRAPAVQWSARKPWRAAAGVAIAAARLPLERWRRVLRFVIHPADVEHPAVADSVRWSLEALLRDRKPTSYADVVAA